MLLISHTIFVYILFNALIYSCIYFPISKTYHYSFTKKNTNTNILFHEIDPLYLFPKNCNIMEMVLNNEKLYEFLELHFKI